MTIYGHPEHLDKIVNICVTFNLIKGSQTHNLITDAGEEQRSDSPAKHFMDYIDLFCLNAGSLQ